MKKEEMDEKLQKSRHSLAHILAKAIVSLYPSTKLTIGPAIEDGFYYDVDLDEQLTPDHFDAIEKKMKEILNKGEAFVRKEVSKQEALKLFEGNEYKTEIINELPEDEKITLYYTGDDFFDLCRGPHVESSKNLQNYAYKIHSVNGAYWRGSEKNKMLQRVYVYAFADKKQLADHINMLEEAKKRDHRKLGKELKLFMLSPEGPGFPFYLPNGMIVKNLLIDYWHELHRKAGYSEIATPMMLSRHLWETSGHWDHYKENMYTTKIDDVDFAIKPMNCPGGVLVYKNSPHSYRDLPLRLGELGLVHRHEKSGELGGLMRVRCFTQDDAHIFCRQDQLLEEITNILDFVKTVMDIFGFEFIHTVSTRPEEKFIGSVEVWDTATKALIDALEDKGLKYTINEGDGAFYGPKIDIKLKDAIGRLWQCATIQCDFNLPERFDLSYIGQDGEKHRPVMLHRVILGSVDRFLGVLIEHFAGAFPVWISPVQVKIMNITDESAEYAETLYRKLKQAGIRVEKDLRNEKIGYKIREAQMEKVPHMIVVGNNEMNENKVSVRLRNGETKNNLDFSAYISVLQSLVDSKSLELWAE